MNMRATKVAKLWRSHLCSPKWSVPFQLIFYSALNCILPFPLPNSVWLRISYRLHTLSYRYFCAVYIVDKHKICCCCSILVRSSLKCWCYHACLTCCSFLGLSSRNEISEGARGCTPEPVASSSVNEEAASTLSKEQEEIRRRRIQKFGQTQGSDWGYRWYLLNTEKNPYLYSNYLIF